ncbi:MAG: tetratricopeptide repeat protein, partial [Terriglobales bacterium]
GSTILTEALQNRRRGSTKAPAERFGLLRALPVIAAGVLCLLTCVRMIDLASDRSYLGSDSEVLLGPGESWWFPERAATFIEREHFPGNIFQLYNLGGFTAWRLGPTYGDFIDGRNVSHAVWEEQQELLSSPLDSPVWEAESDRRSINILFFSLARFYGLGDQNLLSLCQSHLWRPIYMDEVSIVLLRNRSENRPWIDKYEVNCQTHNFASPPKASRGELSNFYANAGAILLLLGRYNEAEEALDHGVAISPENPSIHLALARLYEAQQQLGDAEREFKAALSVKRYDAAFWDDLGRFYYSHGRYADARPYVLTAAKLSTFPINEYTELGHIDLELSQPRQALIDYAKAEEAAQGREDLDPEFLAQIAEGHTVAYLALGERERAIEFLQEAIRRTPKSASRWQALGDLYDAVGQQQLAEQAHEQARALSQ